MNTEKRIALACFVGATLGALVALELNHYFWWVGVIFGGVLGYTIFRFEEIIQATRQAWNEIPDAKTSVARLKRRVKSFVSKSVTLAFKILSAAAIVVGVIGFIYPILLSLDAREYQLSFAESSRRMGVPPIMWAVGTLFVVVVGMANYFRYRKNEHTEARDILVMSILFSPFVSHLTVAVILFSISINWLMVLKKKISLLRTWSLLIAAIRQVFITVHSELRLLCMTDAMIGAISGYCFGNALIGGIVGAVCGVLNYRLISVRWLKLVKV